MNLNWISLGYLSKPRRMWILQSCDGCKLYSQPQYCPIYNLFSARRSQRRVLAPLQLRPPCRPWVRKIFWENLKIFCFLFHLFKSRCEDCLIRPGAKCGCFCGPKFPDLDDCSEGPAFGLGKFWQNILLLNKKACQILPVGYIFVYCRAAKEPIIKKPTRCPKKIVFKNFRFLDRYIIFQNRPKRYQPACPFRSLTISTVLDCLGR